MKSRYVFIVGLPRSGTTLIYRILNTSSSVVICPETHFFGKPMTITYIMKRLINKYTPSYNSNKSGVRKKIARLNNIRKGGSSGRIVNYIYQYHGQYWSWLRENVDQREFLKLFQQSDRSEKALFLLLLNVYGIENPIIGEKTPQHLFYVPTLLDWFPEAKIIHIMRHPCAVYTSMKYYTRSERPFVKESILKKVVNRSNLLLLLSIAANWNRAVNLHFYYQQRYPNNYFLIKFENLVHEPARVVNGLCDYINIEFSQDLLNPVGRHNSSLLPRSEQVEGIDKSLANKWKERISPFEERSIRLLSNTNMEQMGYPIGDLKDEYA